MYQRQVLPDRPRWFRVIVPPVAREAGDWLEAQVDRVDALLARVKRVEFYPGRGGALEFYPPK